QSKWRKRWIRKRALVGFVTEISKSQIAKELTVMWPSLFQSRRIRRRLLSRTPAPRLEPLEGRLLPATFTVTNSGDAGAGSLRQAILDANDNPGADTIEFQIPGAGVHTIRPHSALPVINRETTIDGYSQGRSTPDPTDDAVPNTLAVGTN